MIGLLLIIIISTIVWAFLIVAISLHIVIISISLNLGTETAFVTFSFDFQILHCCHHHPHHVLSHTIASSFVRKTVSAFPTQAKTFFPLFQSSRSSFPIHTHVLVN